MKKYIVLLLSLVIVLNPILINNKGTVVKAAEAMAGDINFTQAEGLLAALKIFINKDNEGNGLNKPISKLLFMDMINKSLNITSTSTALDGELKVSEALKVVIDALGYGDLANRYGRTGYLTVASDIRISNNINSKADETLTVRDSVILIYNMLNAKPMEQITFGNEIEYSKNEYSSLLEKSFHIFKKRGRVIANEVTALGITGQSSLSKGYIGIDSNTYKITGFNTLEYLGYTVDFFVREETSEYDQEIIYIYKSPSFNHTFCINAKDMTSIERVGTDVEIKYEDKNERSKLEKFDVVTDFVYNGKVTSFDIHLVKGLLTNKCGEIVLLDGDYNGTYDTVFITNYEIMIADNTSKSLDKIWGKYGGMLNIDRRDIYVSIKKNNHEILATDIKEWDVLHVAKSIDGKCINIVVTAYQTVGHVDGLNDETVMIDGLEYDLSDFYMNEISKIGSDITPIVLGMTARFYFDIYGNVVALDRQSSDERYGYIISGSLSKDLSKIMSLKLVTIDGKIIILKSGDKINIKTDMIDGRKSASEAWNIISNSGLNGTIRQLIRFKLNQEGKLYYIETAEDGTGIGVPVETREEWIRNNRFRKSATSALRTYNSTTYSFLEDATGSVFPKFYLESKTTILLVPPLDASSDLWDEASNFTTMQPDQFRDNTNYTVEAYNDTIYGGAGIVLYFARNILPENTMRPTIDFTIVKDIAKGIDSKTGDTIDRLYGFQRGVLNSFEGNIGVFSKNGTPFAVGDVVQLLSGVDGKVYKAEFVCKLDNVASQVIQSSWQLTVIGDVVSSNGTFIRVNTGTSYMNVKCFNKTAYSVYSKSSKTVTPCEMSDIIPGYKVLIRTNYTLGREVTIIKD